MVLNVTARTLAAREDISVLRSVSGLAHPAVNQAVAAPAITKLRITARGAKQIGMLLIELLMGVKAVALGAEAPVPFTVHPRGQIGSLRSQQFLCRVALSHQNVLLAQAARDAQA
jgi:hypothetical protein